MNLIVRILIAIFAMATFLISGYAFAFIMVSLLPTIVTYSIDKKQNKTASNIVGIFNTTGMIPYLIELLNSGLNASSKAQAMMGSFNVWLTVYGAAGIGFLVVWIMPQLFANFFVYREDRKVKKYKEEQLKIVDEWGQRVVTRKERVDVEIEKPKEAKPQPK